MKRVIVAQSSNVQIETLEASQRVRIRIYGPSAGDNGRFATLSPSRAREVINALVEALAEV